MSSEAVALGITFLIHLIGICFLFGLMLREDNGGWRDWWPRDDDDDGGGPGPPEPDPGPPLPGAEQSPRRLREPGRLADAHRRSRRPEHAPERAPQRERV